MHFRNKKIFWAKICKIFSNKVCSPYLILYIKFHFLRESRIGIALLSVLYFMALLIHKNWEYSDFWRCRIWVLNPLCDKWWSKNLGSVSKDVYKMWEEKRIWAWLDRNLLRMSNLWIKISFNWILINFVLIFSCSRPKLKSLGLLLSATKSQKWAKPSVFMSIPMF